MEKIKINLMSGSNIEKPLITAFKSGNGVYVVLDNEINGTMGLPIILVSKLANNTLTKIVDQNEWGAVKEALRMIIAGNVMDYVVVAPALVAEDVFFSQLTLPVASFDALKNNYHPNSENAGTVVTDNVSSENPVGGKQINNVQNNREVLSQPVVATPEVASQVVNPAPINGPVMPQSPVGVTPEVTPNVINEPQPVIPAMPSAPMDAQTVAPVADPIADPVVANPATNIPNPQNPTVPNVEPIPEVSNNNVEEVPVDFTADKEAFLKACENMFDALVAKFKK